jgi:Zn-dependent protease with chaperone function
MIYIPPFFNALRMSFSFDLYFLDVLKKNKEEGDLNEEERARIELKIKELSEKLGITQRVQIYEISGTSHGSAKAFGSLLSQKIGIVFERGFLQELTEEAQEFVLAHELSHIKSNDHLSFGVVEIVSQIASTFFLKMIFSASKAETIGFFISGWALSLFSQWREKCADANALLISSSGLKGARDFFEHIKLLNLTFKLEKSQSPLSFLKDRMIDRDGENLFDHFHPKMSKRMELLTKLSYSKSF